jgi:Cu-processing system permease protein
MDYPLEEPMVVFSCLNLMGARSAIFQDFFGNQWGIIATIAIMKKI